MGLGERIKQARLEKGLSQRQLCGDTITRNMLSQIENGAARPSMDTLAYLARQLDRPVSFFLGEQTVCLPNRQVMEAARRHFAAGQYRQVLERLEDYQAPDALFDSERWLLESLGLMELARQVLAEGKTVYAQNLLEKAQQAGARSAYFTPPQQREWMLLMYQARPEQAAQLASETPADDRELLLRARAALDARDYAKSARLLEGAQVQDQNWHYLRGQAAMGQKDYALAAEHCRLAEQAYPLECAKALERCYRELEDYKMAYHYACKQREL